MKKLTAILCLPENWDSYGAPRIDPRAAEAAVNVLGEVASLGVAMPEIVPTNRGMVQLEWHQNGIDLEIEVIAPDRYLAFFRDRAHDREIEAEASAESPELTGFLIELSHQVAQ